MEEKKTFDNEKNRKRSKYAQKGSLWPRESGSGKAILRVPYVFNRHI